MRVKRIATELACAVALSAASFQAAGGLVYDYSTMRLEVRANTESIASRSLELPPERLFGTLMVLAFTGGQDVFGVGELRVDRDPYARWAIELTNPLDTPLNMTFTVSIPTTRMRSDEWRAAASFIATLTDLDGDGASMLPTVPTSTGELGAPTVMQMMDSGVSLRISDAGPFYFGGAPSAPLGQEGLSAAPGASASRSWASTADMLPDHSWIGPDVAWNTLNLQIGFQISPHDSLVLRGGIDITPVGATDPGNGVPEPGTIWLSLAGLLLAALGLRRPAARARGQGQVRGAQLRNSIVNYEIRH